MAADIISISIPPFPDFIEGNFRVFRKGQMHPKRSGLGYFDLIVVTKGCMFLRENGTDYAVRENEFFLLLPDGQHCSWKPCEEETDFYWIHFYTTAQWKQDAKPSHFVSDLPIPDLHYHQCSYTLHLPKHAKIQEEQALFELIQSILDSTLRGDVSDDFRECDAGVNAGVSRNYDMSSRNIHNIWRTEELFLRLLRMLEEQATYRDRLTQLAEQVYVYLEKNIGGNITNTHLEEQFHLHSNYIARATKATFGKTPLELLLALRMEYAKRYLVRSGYSLSAISEIVGFHSEIYFSNCFKKYVGVSPREYRRNKKK